MSDIKVLLVTEERLLLSALELALETFQGLRVVGAERDWPRALASLALHRPNVMVVDERTFGPCCSPHELKDFTTGHIDIKVIVLTSFVDLERDRAIATAGVAGILPLDVEVSALVHAIRSVFAGQWVLPGPLFRDLLSHGPNGTGPQLPSKDDEIDVADLSEREKAILTMISHGYKDAQIASSLCLAERTVQFYVNRICNKLNAKNRIHAVTKVLRKQVPLEESLL